MTTPVRPRPATPIVALLLLLTVALSGFAAWRAESRSAEQTDALERLQEQMAGVLREVTRLRIEQSAEGMGPQALLEKLRTYAPLTADARVTEPQFQRAKKELAAIQLAFEACGEDAWQPILDRLAETDPRKDYEEVRRLLEILVRLDPPAGKQIVKEVLLGHRMPNPRLRRAAARILLAHDKPLAQRLLRQILLTESSRGVDPDRARQHGMTIPDPAAYATTGFNNFVQLYIQSEDPKIEDTLLMVMARVEHDAITIQDCIKELGRRKCQRALEPIKKLYDNPPLRQQNPLFLNICVQAVYDIAGADAKDWLEQKLPTAPTDLVASRIQAQLDKIK
ncbi:MAG TPA: hypothetical protein ENI87_06370 [bacterium]|nr:hypothetical protein [bacterium]